MTLPEAIELLEKLRNRSAVLGSDNVDALDLAIPILRRVADEAQRAKER